ncbi:MAG: transglutaminase family protein [Waddliaceae bacterium]
MKLLLLIFIPFLLSASHESTLYKTLDPRSIQDLVTFYTLYPESDQGNDALAQVWNLLNYRFEPNEVLTYERPLRALFERTHDLIFDENTLQSIETLGASLPHRHLRGHHVWSEEEVLALQTDEIDLARAILITELKEDPHFKEKIRTYEALLDLFALQITPYLQTDTPQEKINCMNKMMYEQIGVRYPPLSEHVKAIDTYSSLASVVDSHHGVCLGTSILYLTLAQRLHLSLEAVTPPGHIYVRYCNGDQVINIETTARGANVKTEHFIGIEGNQLITRSIKEVIGLTYFNKASRQWADEEIESSLQSYQSAEKYLKNDPLLQELLGFSYLFNGKEKEGVYYLKEAVKGSPAGQPFILAEDYLNHKASLPSIQLVLKEGEDNHLSWRQRKSKLEELLSAEPEFRAGYLTLAKINLNLRKRKEAIKALQRYEALDAKSPFVEFLLCSLHLEECNYPMAKKHLKAALELSTHEKLQKVRRHLLTVSPENSLIN